MKDYNDLTEEKAYYPVALTIAGSDSGGGAGIQADLRTFSAFGVYGCSAITAVTHQNPREVRGITEIPAADVKAQCEAVIDAFELKAVKTGMLFDENVIQAVAEALRYIDAPLIVDPVMISTSGTPLLKETAISTLKNKLLPLASWITPNIPEAEALTGITIKTERDMIETAKRCSEQWNCGCVLKAGHLDNDGKWINDIVAVEDRAYTLSSPFVAETQATHGTGCVFSAAIAANLALDETWQDAMISAKAFVYGSLAEAIFPGENVEAMYPPSENYFSKVKLKRIRS